MAGVAGVVILFNPSGDVAENIATYLDEVERLFLVDNSESVEVSPTISGLLANDKIVYLPQGGNVGVARGLNVGAEQALAAGYRFLLTMDQDSRASGGLVTSMLQLVHHLDTAEIGIISPFHLTKPGDAPPAGIALQEVMTPMTSGCLLSLAAFREVGPFREDFFIDFVDNEYCLRLKARGFRVLRANTAVLLHSVGDTRKYGPFVATHHSPLRRYYKTRNRLQVFSEYLRIFPGHCLFDMVRLCKEIGSILLFEKDKGAKLKMMWRGYEDFRQGRYGRYQERR